jgi:hypothetical protein
MFIKSQESSRWLQCPDVIKLLLAFCNIIKVFCNRHRTKDTVSVVSETKCPDFRKDCSSYGTTVATYFCCALNEQQHKSQECTWSREAMNLAVKQIH